MVRCQLRLFIPASAENQSSISHITREHAKKQCLESMPLMLGIMVVKVAP
jgi:hypothetical protein